VPQYPEPQSTLPTADRGAAGDRAAAGEAPQDRSRSQRSRAVQVSWCRWRPRSGEDDAVGALTREVSMAPCGSGVCHKILRGRVKAAQDPQVTVRCPAVGPGARPGCRGSWRGVRLGGVRCAAVGWRCRTRVPPLATLPRADMAARRPCRFGGVDRPVHAGSIMADAEQLLGRPVTGFVVVNRVGPAPKSKSGPDGWGGPYTSRPPAWVGQATCRPQLQGQGIAST